MDGKGSIYDIAGKTFGVVFAGFIFDSLQDILIWLIVMFSIIMCDLIAAIRKNILLGNPVSFSRAIRNTMGKMITYFSFVIMAVFINHAYEEQYNFDKWAVLIVCFGEFFSILSHILKPMGYNINFPVIVSIVLNKLLGITKEESRGILTKTDKKDKSKKQNNE
jgi:hypothetical protein